jgi:dTDP-4-dehydrorhamnose 3,5-epimerase
MSRFVVDDLPLPGLKRVQRRRLGDDRGFLTRVFCADELSAAGWTKPIAQLNHTFTAQKGCVRGLHFQRPPHAEMKLVSCLRGAVLDVAVDVRRGSPTFLRWHAEELTADNGVALLLPEGFAHGFQTLTDDVEMLYCHSAPFVADAEAGLRPTDPRLAVRWPLEVIGLSPRDAGHPLLDDVFAGITP